jgi:serine/threonine protein kinase
MTSNVLYRGPNSTVCRVYAEQLEKTVIIKQHNEDVQTSLFLRNKFAKEFRTGKILENAHVVPYLSFEKSERSEIIVMEDTNSRSLDVILNETVI